MNICHPITPVSHQASEPAVQLAILTHTIARNNNEQAVPAICLQLTALIAHALTAQNEGALRSAGSGALGSRLLTPITDVTLVSGIAN